MFIMSVRINIRLNSLYAKYYPLEVVATIFHIQSEMFEPSRVKYFHLYIDIPHTTGLIHIIIQTHPTTTKVISVGGNTTGREATTVEDRSTFSPTTRFSLQMRKEKTFRK